MAARLACVTQAAVPSVNADAAPALTRAASHRNFCARYSPAF